MRISLGDEKRERLKRLSIVAGCAAAVLSLVLLEGVGENGYLERRARRRQIQALSGEIGKLRDENHQLNQRVKDLRSDPRAIEELAREHLHLGRPGEIIVTLPAGPPPAPPSPAPAQ